MSNNGQNNDERSDNQAVPIEPYTALGISTTVRSIIKRDEIQRNLDHIANIIHGAMWFNMQFPIRLVTLAEAALTGFTDQAFNIDHETAAREMFIEIPGKETDYMADLAKHYHIYLIFQCKARWPEVIENRFFNTALIIDPSGKIIHKYAKNHLFPREHSTTPHDVWDRWVEIFGDGLESFWPVAKTEIGNIGTLICNDGAYFEASRALALNGAELIYRPNFTIPFVCNGVFELQNRAHAMFNNCYVIGPNTGPNYVAPWVHEPFDSTQGHGHIVDYMGQIISRSISGANTVVSGTIDIEQLRKFRHTALWGNWLKDMRTELFHRVYEKPILPKNIALDQPPPKHKEYDEILRKTIQLLEDRNIYTPPAQKPRLITTYH